MGSESAGPYIGITVLYLGEPILKIRRFKGDIPHSSSPVVCLKKVVGDLMELVGYLREVRARYSVSMGDSRIDQIVGIYRSVAVKRLGELQDPYLLVFAGEHLGEAPDPVSEAFMEIRRIDCRSRFDLGDFCLREYAENKYPTAEDMDADLWKGGLDTVDAPFDCAAYMSLEVLEPFTEGGLAHLEEMLRCYNEANCRGIIPKTYLKKAFTGGLTGMISFV